MQKTVHLSIETLINLLEIRLLSQGYTTFTDEDFTIFEANENSHWGQHTIRFEMNACYCDGLYWSIGLVEGNDNREAISNYIQETIDTMLG